MKKPSPVTPLLLLIPALVLLHLFVAPYTKVEESPAIQAAHDILVYGVPIPVVASPPSSTPSFAVRLRSAYDHLSFPGAVPRSFVGPVLLAGLAQPVVALATGFGPAQIVVRAVLGLANAAALAALAASLDAAYGHAVAAWWVVLMAGQFHVWFYASRTLGNMFAFGLTTFATSLLLPHPDPSRVPGRRRQALSLLTFATVVFRAELSLLLAATGLHLLVSGRATLTQLVFPVAVSAVVALLVSVPIDSYFWLTPVWPELVAFYYNAVLGRASDWGAAPWHWYLTSALPRLLLNPVAWAGLLPLSVVVPATRRPATDLVLPAALFVVAYSLQPHKETRFVLYVVPPITAAAALGANYVFVRRAKSRLYAVASAAIVLSVLASAAAALAMLLVSSLNYPGGDALTQLFAVMTRARTDSAGSTNTGGTGAKTGLVAVHTDVLSCMTGVTLFGQNPRGLPLALLPPDAPSSSSLSSIPGQPPLVRFDKTEDPELLRDPAFWARFDYVLVEDWAGVPGAWETAGLVQGYAGLELLRPGAVAAGSDDEDDDPEAGSAGGSGAVVVGRGAQVASFREWVRKRITRGWWVGPRMETRLRILKRAVKVEE